MDQTVLHNERQVMKITLFTVETCKFSAEEKEYLKSKNLPFEEKDVEKDHAALEQMLKIGNNFAGTPVTEIVFDDATDPAKNPEEGQDAAKPEYKDEVKTGRVVVLKGFTKEEFDKELFPPAEAEAKPADQTTAAPVDPAAPQAPQTTTEPQAAPVTAPANPLDSILQDLQSKIPPSTLDNNPQVQPSIPPSMPPTGPMPTQPVPPTPGAPVDPAAPQVPGIPAFPETRQ